MGHFSAYSLLDIDIIYAVHASAKTMTIDKNLMAFVVKNTYFPSIGLLEYIYQHFQSQLQDRISHQMRNILSCTKPAIRFR